MIIRHIRSICESGAARAGVACLALIFCVAPEARAEDCVGVQSATADPDFTVCDDELEFDLDMALAEQGLPVASVSPASDGMPWIALSKGTIPSKFNANDGSVSVRTSLGTLRDYNARTVSVQRPDDATGNAYAVKLPKAGAGPNTPLDVWSNIDLSGYNGSESHSSRVGFGADYKINRATSVGVSLEKGDARSSPTAGIEQDQKASAYVTMQAAPMLSLDARTEWQAGNSEFAASAGAAQKSAVILAPKVNHSFSLEGGTTLEPFVTYKRAFDLSTSRKEGVDTSFDAASAGAGVTYSKPDAYSLSVTADVENVGMSAEPQSVSSKFRLSVPIR
ncbi:MAG: hypothetical protein K2Q04_18390 [Hyphomicrobium sp.]|nr:hypothetical protein [Hyphomicrobium sp.]